MGRLWSGAMGQGGSLAVEEDERAAMVMMFFEEISFRFHVHVDWSWKQHSMHAQVGSACLARLFPQRINTKTPGSPQLAAARRTAERHHPSPAPPHSSSSSQHQACSIMQHASPWHDNSYASHLTYIHLLVYAPCSPVL